mgnify:CR=1 FL=1
MYKKNHVFLILKYFILILFVMFILVPFIWTFYSSLRTESNLFSGKLFQINEKFSFHNYKRLFETGPGGNFKTYIKNSFIISSISTVLVVFLSLIGGFTLSRFEVKLKNFFILFLLSSYMFPHVLIMIPLFNIFLNLSLLDTKIGIVLIHSVLSLAFGVWMMKGFCDSIPLELDEAGLIDGLKPMGVLFKIILPLVSPGLAVVAFYSFMASWGDFLFVSVFAQSLKTQTLTIGLNNLTGATQVQWGILNAATIISVLPTILIFSFFQRWIVEGLTAGAVKG